MSYGELCDNKIYIQGQEVKCRAYIDHTGHHMHSSLPAKTETGKEIRYSIAWNQPLP